MILTVGIGKPPMPSALTLRQRCMKEHNDFDLVIKASHTELHYWKDLWRYRELFFFLAWRDVLVRYK